MIGCGDLAILGGLPLKKECCW